MKEGKVRVGRWAYCVIWCMSTLCAVFIVWVCEGFSQVTNYSILQVIISLNTKSCFRFSDRLVN